MATQVQAQVPAPKQKSYTLQLLFAGLGGLAGASTIYPLDLSKSILQDQRAVAGQKPLYNGIGDVIKAELKRGGVRSLYRGLSANMIGILPEKATKFFVNDYIREYFGCDKPEGGRGGLAAEVFAGAAAGVTQQVFTVPMELFKIIMQTSKEGEAGKSLGQLVKETVQQKGIKGMFTGAGATLFRDIPFSIMYFGMYGYGKKKQQQDKGRTLTALERLGVSSIAGVISAALATPMDVVKTRCQRYPEQYPTILGTIRKIATEEGVMAFTKGVGPRVLIIAPLFGTAMMVYESLNEAFNK